MEIRAISIEDFASWSILWQGYLEFYQTTLPIDTTQHVFKRICDPKDFEIGGFIAFNNGAAIGLVHYIVHANTWAVNDVCYLEDLYVSPDVRGGGVGRKLIEKVADFARENNLRHVYWQTQKPMNARKFYMKKWRGQASL